MAYYRVERKVHVGTLTDTDADWLTKIEYQNFQTKQDALSFLKTLYNKALESGKYVTQFVSLERRLNKFFVLNKYARVEEIYSIDRLKD